MGGARIPRVGLRPQLLAHPVFRHHAPRDVRGPLQIVLGPRRDVAEDHLLGDPAAKQHLEAIEQLLARHEVPVFGRKLLRVAERPDPARNDRHLVDRVRVGKHHGDNGVPRFVVGDDFLLFGIHGAVFLLEPADDPVGGLLKIGHGDVLVIVAGREQRRFVHEVGEVGADEPGGHGGDAIEIDVRPQDDVLRVDLENGLPAADIRLVNRHVPVEASGPEQGRVQNLGTVGGRHDDHAGAGIEAVHFNQELVQGLLALVVAVDGVEPARLAQGIQLVDKDDARRLLLGLPEQVPDARRPDAHKHLDELGAAHAEEGNPRFSGDRFGQQRLARPRGTHQQNPFGDPAA